MALKIDGGLSTFSYPSTHWTTNSVLNTGSPAFDGNEAKLSSYNVMPFRELMVTFRTCRTTACGLGPYATVYTSTTAVSSLLALISPGTAIGTGLGRAGWMNLLPGSALEANCNMEGINRACSGPGSNQVRIGIIGNNENDCASCDTWMGVGGYYAPCSGNANFGAGNLAYCTSLYVGGGTAPNLDYYAFAYVFIR